MCSERDPFESLAHAMDSVLVLSGLLAVLDSMGLFGRVVDIVVSLDVIFFV